MRYREIIEVTRKPQEPRTPAEGRQARAKEIGLQKRILTAQNTAAKKLQGLRNQLIKA
jgi:hypothetical protein